jgi:hypothetical protein
MSSWKQTSGISKYNNADKINTNTLAVNKLILKEPYSGIFSIDGGIDVSGLSQFNDIVVNGETVFQGFVTFNQDFAMNGNVRTQNIYVSESAFFNDSAFLHGHNDGLGLNTENANAAFDISTNLINGFNILSSQNENISVLAQNNQQAGIKLGVDLSSAYIHFFHENPISSNSPDARFQYETGGDLLLDVSNNFAVLSSMSVSQRETDHINNENLVIYDASNGDYFELFYNNTVRTGAALSCVSYDASSNTFAYLTTPEKRGFAIGGGAYPDDIDRSMGVLSICDTSDNKIPSQTVISGSDLVKYRTTTGINTLKPHSEQSVLDVNGPIFVNNNDIHNVTGELGFEVYSMSVAFSQRNNVLALGSPYQIADPRNHNRILKSVDYGASWSLIDVPIGVVGVDSLSSIAAFDASNCLMIGENEFVQSSIDGGLTWTKLDAILQPVLVGTDYSNLIMKRQLRPNGKVIAFFTASDMSYNIYTFDISFGDLSLNQYYPHEIPTGLNVLNSIATNDTNLFGAGNAIVSFITTNVAAGPGSEDSYVNPPWVDISSQSIYSSGYTYTHIHAHNDLVVAVGPNIISSSSNNGVSWIDVSFNNIDFTNVYTQDALHAIAVGSLANVWFTEDAGVSWNVFDAYLNASGKSNLISTSLMFNTVVMSDENTVLLSNRIQSYIPGSQLGESNIFNVFAPNFANAANNYVLDASGSLRISENLVVGNNLTSYSGIFENLVINGSINIPGSSTNIFGNLIIGNGYSTSSAPANGMIVEGVVGIGTDTPNPAFAVDISGDSYIDGSQIIGSSYSGATAPSDGLLVQGTVGIGLSNPRSSYFLDVGGNSGVRGSQIIGSDSSYLNATAPNDGLLVQGTVGIGTETPDSTKILHVVGDVRIQGNLSTDGSFNIIETDVTTTEILNVVNDGTGPALIVNQTGLQPVMDVQDDGVSCLYIEDGGNVGLGLTNPNHVLDISGNLGVRGSQILGSNASYITATAPDDGLLVEGTVGIGLVDPSLNFALDVSGNIGIRGSQILGSNASYITATAPDDGLLVEGTVGIGVLVPTRKLDVSGDFFAHDISTNHLSVRDSQTIGSSYITATAPDDGLLVEGTVGIGLVDPSLNFALDVSGNIGIRGSQILGSSASYITATAPDDGLLVEGTVGIGTTNPDVANLLHVSGNTYVNGNIRVPDGGSIFVGDGLTPGDNRLRLHTAGNASYLDYGTTNLIIRNDSGNTAVTIYDNKNMKVEGEVAANSFNSVSDIRLKKDIVGINNSLEKVSQMNGVEYVLMNDSSNRKFIGFIAQDLEKVLPEVVNTSNDSDGIKSVSYSNITALLVEAIKELNTEVKYLREKLEKNV